jgi:hypothetical protein
MNMGNWRRANIVGSVDEAEVDALREAIMYDRKTFEGFGPLCNGGVCGLPVWAQPTFNATGNLAERNYDGESVLEHLVELAKVAPSLQCFVHIGGDHESDTCTETVVFADQRGRVIDPQISELGMMSEVQMHENFEVQIRRFRRSSAVTGALHALGTMSTKMTFGQAIVSMKRGFPVCREGWNGSIGVHMPREGDALDLPFIMMYTAQGKYIPWAASHADVLAEDWMVAEEQADTSRKIPLTITSPEHKRLAVAACSLIGAIYGAFVGDLPDALNVLAEVIKKEGDGTLMCELREALREESRI